MTGMFTGKWNLEIDADKKQKRRGEKTAMDKSKKISNKTFPSDVINSADALILDIQSLQYEKINSVILPSLFTAALTN